MTLTARVVDTWRLHKTRWKAAHLSSASHITVKIVDHYQFTVVVTLDDAKVLQQVKERVKNRVRVWWMWEANQGAGWDLQPGISCFSEINLATLTNTIELKKLIRKGIPPEFRAKVWMAVSGAAKKRSAAPESYYKDLTAAVEGKETAATRQIDQDLGRTFPSHPWLDTPTGHAALRRVLVAYSFRDSRVGYCQGMNYVAALLLLVMKSEEEAFWMLAVLLEDILVKDCYTDDLSGCRVEQRVFRDLLEKNCPRLATHLDYIGFDVSLVITEWFLCLFAKSLPSETTMRVWDVLFNEGARVLFRIALAIFKIKEDALLSSQYLGEIISIFHQATHRSYDPDMLLKVAFEKLGVMTTNTLANHRMKHHEIVMEELERRFQKLKSLDAESMQSSMPLSSS